MSELAEAVRHTPGVETPGEPKKEKEEIRNSKLSPKSKVKKTKPQAEPDSDEDSSSETEESMLR